MAFFFNKWNGNSNVCKDLNTSYLVDSSLKSDEILNTFKKGTDIVTVIGLFKITTNIHYKGLKPMAGQLPLYYTYPVQNYERKNNIK